MSRFFSEVLFNEQTSNWGSPFSTCAGIFNVHAQRNFRLFSRRKGHEHAVVSSGTILDRARFATNGDARGFGELSRACSILNHRLHGVKDGVKVFRTHPHIVTNSQFAWFSRSTNVADEVGFNVPTSVGHDGSQVGHMQRRGQKFPFTNADGIDGAVGPSSFPVEVVVVGRVGDKPSPKAGQMPAQVRPKPKRFDSRGPPTHAEPGVVKLVKFGLA